MPPNSRVHKWKPCNLDNIKRFIAIIIGMTVDGKDSNRRTTGVNIGLSQPTPFLPSWAGNRFSTSPSFSFTSATLTFVRKEDNRVYDPLFKIRPFMDHLLQRFQELLQSASGCGPLMNPWLVFKGCLMFYPVYAQENLLCGAWRHLSRPTAYLDTHSMQVNTTTTNVNNLRNMNK